MKKLLVVLGSVVAGCAAPAASPHVVTGNVEQRTFPATVDRAEIVRAGITVVSAPVSADGGFSLTIPPGVGYHLELTSPADRNGLIQPRASGVLDTTFAVRGGGAPFNVGVVRAIGSPTGVTFIYSSSSGECQDGKTANGEVCVDDQGAEACDQGDSGQSDGENSGEGDSENTADDAGTTGTAVADHNIPSSIGCGDGGDSGGDHQNEGDEQGDH